MSVTCRVAFKFAFPPVSGLRVAASTPRPEHYQSSLQLAPFDGFGYNRDITPSIMTRSAPWVRRLGAPAFGGWRQLVHACMRGITSRRLQSVAFARHDRVIHDEARINELGSTGRGGRGWRDKKVRSRRSRGITFAWAVCFNVNHTSLAATHGMFIKGKQLGAGGFPKKPAASSPLDIWEPSDAMPACGHLFTWNAHALHLDAMTGRRAQGTYMFMQALPAPHPDNCTLLLLRRAPRSRRGSRAMALPGYCCYACVLFLLTAQGPRVHLCTLRPHPPHPALLLLRCGATVRYTQRIFSFSLGLSAATKAEHHACGCLASPLVTGGLLSFSKHAPHTLTASRALAPPAAFLPLCMQHAGTHPALSLLPLADTHACLHECCTAVSGCGYLPLLPLHVSLLWPKRTLCIAHVLSVGAASTIAPRRGTRVGLSFSLPRWCGRPRWGLGSRFGVLAAHPVPWGNPRCP